MTIEERANSIFCPNPQIPMTYAEDMQRIGYIRGYKEMLNNVCNWISNSRQNLKDLDTESYIQILRKAMEE